MEDFWAWQEVVTQQNGYHGPQFRATRRTTQEGATLLTLFNMVVDNVVPNWLSMKVEDGGIS